MASGERLPSDPALTGEVAEATNQFATELYPLVIEEGENLAFSPTSIAIALAMTSAGGAGTTREQIEAVFHLGEIADPHGGWNAVDQALESRAGEVARDDASTDELFLAVVNRLWAQEGFKVEEPFLAVMAASYGAGVSLADFINDPEGSRLIINEWVAGQTNDRIPELIPPNIINDFIRLVLTNAIYFKAPWASPFDPGATQDRPFTLLDGTTVETPLMSHDGSFARATGDGWEAVELAYGGEELEMVIVVPDTGRFEDTEAQLGAGLFDEISPGLDRSALNLTMPKFEIRSPVPLNEPLAELGMPDPFEPFAADFSGINVEVGKDLFIQAVVHEAFVAVDETGTEAAAATAVIIGLESASPSMVIDRPFLWAIRDIPTGIILFLGRVLDPTIAT